MKVREPVARPLDVVAAELLLSASQAFLVGVLMYLAIGVWDDRGVGTGPVAIILALLGLAIGGTWLYWLLGGVGWPMAAANTPVAMFLGFALVLGWLGEDLFRVPGVPLPMSVAAAVYGIICGVFLDSPRRWRWDQRQRLRPGTSVPRVSSTTRALAAAVPRSLPRRPRASGTTSGLVARIGRTDRSSGEAGMDVTVASVPGAAPLPDLAPSGRLDDEEARAPGVDDIGGSAETAGAGGSPSGLAAQPAVAAPTAAEGSSSRSERPVGVGVTGAGGEAQHDGAIELPTSVEPRAQRSPWAWAAPPEWNRDEDDEAVGSGPSKRA